MFGKKDDTGKYTLDGLARDLEQLMVKTRKEDLNLHGVEAALEKELRILRGYVAARLRF